MKTRKVVVCQTQPLSCEQLTNDSKWNCPNWRILVDEYQTI